MDNQDTKNFHFNTHKDEITKVFSADDLKKSPDGEVFIGCNSYVYDASSSEHYRAGGSYHIFAGKDVSVALAKMSFADEDLNSTDYSCLKDQEIVTLIEWMEKYDSKYPIVGKMEGQTPLKRSGASTESDKKND
mmetsp:Transcript_62721/g.71984  ORF Transcript_62721/g.71984 Transcript_62721/m.71984 type:complete len:134 (+) Transcript_62721:146-547(+)|eukprot:CAMPEP_0114973322 /NCGR_PEP_ID=MMETSP0216-20121206/892_1 /TAXON_ID=223996 /ORGANISM="Protocruzia adherens, Strain Boccale" /LENGTH=133 /DNA_ID=CAMNT_0002333805 /DNA_START=89 /DNA_END=490 /DNA_ORIENTATION=+